MVSTSFCVMQEDKRGEQREPKHAKHGRHSANVEPTKRFWCLKGRHHGQICLKGLQIPKRFHIHLQHSPFRDVLFLAIKVRYTM